MSTVHTATGSSAATPTPTAVRFEHHEPGRLGIGERTPRLSWIVTEAPDSYHQVAAELEITVIGFGSAPRTTRHLIDSDEQVLVPWPAPPLASRDRVHARVRVMGDQGWGPWSEPGIAETGLLERTDWDAAFVGPDGEEPAGPRRRPSRVRHTFTVPGEIAQARLHLSGHGLVEAEINGARVGDEELTPGWTSYQHRLRWATFDVTGHLTTGANAIGIWLADGWWRGRLGYGGGIVDVYGDRLAALAQLEIVTVDGERLTIASGADWRSSDSPTLMADLYDGERVDLRLHDPAWSTSDYNDADWTPVRVVPIGSPDAAANLVAPTGPPVRCTEELTPVSVTAKGDGRWLLDFGQNHSGRLRIDLDAPEGTIIRLRHAEVLQDGELYTRTLRDAEATDEVVLPGGRVQWEPRATIHGYRYAEVTGWPGELAQGQIVSRVLHTDMERTGWFSSSNPDLNRLHENVVWSTRSNFVDLPTDCPQRDERLGWTGDIQVFAPTAGYLFNSAGLLTSWLRDVAVEQEEFGDVPFFVPYLRLGGSADGDPIPPAAVWGDVAVLTPDVIHTQTGDTGILRRQYSSAVAWIERVTEAAGPDLICDKTFQFGDWLDPAAPPDDPAAATTEPGLVATAYFAHSSRRLAVIAGLIGETADAERFGALSTQVAAAYAKRFTPDGRLTDDTQTAHALTTLFGLWPDAVAEHAGKARLAELVRESDGRIATGFAGTPLVADALTLAGSTEEAYLLLESHKLPSWLWTVGMGATTIWERWDSMLPDGTINPGEMTSFNHYALGAVADWMHRVLAGLAPNEPGYRSIRFAPRPGGSLTSASTRHRTPYGDAAIEWEMLGTALRVRITVPVGSTGIVDLPGVETVVVSHGTHQFEGDMS